MGNKSSRGVGVLNLSSYPLNIGTSMIATHYFENGVKHGEIFYRSPGAVWFTVFAQASPRITYGTCAKELFVAVGIPVGAAAGAAATVLTGGLLAPAVDVLSFPALAASNGLRAGGMALGVLAAGVNQFIPQADLRATKKGCYGGGEGSWLIIEGGFYNGHYKPFTIRYATRKEVMSRGEFTRESHGHYYTTSGLPFCYSHVCSSACPSLLSSS